MDGPHRAPYYPVLPYMSYVKSYTNLLPSSIRYRLPQRQLLFLRIFSLTHTHSHHIIEYESSNHIFSSSTAATISDVFGLYCYITSYYARPPIDTASFRPGIVRPQHALRTHYESFRLLPFFASSYCCCCVVTEVVLTPVSPRARRSSCEEEHRGNKPGNESIVSRIVIYGIIRRRTFRALRRQHASPPRIGYVFNILKKR